MSRSACTLMIITVVLSLGCQQDSSTTESSTSSTAGATSAAPAPPTGAGSSASRTTASGLMIEDLRLGTGAEATTGKLISVHYTGTFADGTKFDSSLDRGAPIEFILGLRRVIAGWEEGLVGMKIGGKRRLTIPPQLAYGQGGREGIPPNSTLVFEIELMDVK